MEDFKFKGKYKVESIRLQTWDYCNDGFYFVTICTKNRENYFGEIKNGEMFLNDTGRIANIFWKEITKYYDFIELDEFVIMPNHIHGIIIINNPRRDVDLSRLESEDDTLNNNGDQLFHMKHRGITGKHNTMNQKSLSRVIRWYKGRCSFEINKSANKGGFAWQERFYERVLRDESELDHIRNYILNNPRERKEDEHFNG